MSTQSWLGTPGTTALASQITVGSSSALKDPVPISYSSFDGSSASVPGGGSSAVLKTSADTFVAGTYFISTEVDLNFTGAATGTAADIVYVYFGATTGSPTTFPNCTLPTSVPGTGGVFSQTLTGVIVLPVASTITLTITNTGTATGKNISWSGTTYQKIA